MSIFKQDKISRVVPCGRTWPPIKSFFYVETYRMLSQFDLWSKAFETRRNEEIVAREILGQGKIVQVVLIINKVFYPREGTDIAPEYIYFILEHDLFATYYQVLNDALIMNDSLIAKYILDNKPHGLLDFLDNNDNALITTIKNDNIEIFSKMFSIMKSIDNSIIIKIWSMIAVYGNNDFLNYTIDNYQYYVDIMANTSIGREYPIHLAIRSKRESLAINILSYSKKNTLLTTSQKGMPILTMAVNYGMSDLVIALLNHKYAVLMSNHSCRVAKRFMGMGEKYEHFSVVHRAVITLDYDIFMILYRFHIEHDQFIIKAPGGSTILHMFVKSGKIDELEKFVQEDEYSNRYSYVVNNKMLSAVKLAQSLGNTRAANIIFNRYYLQ